MRCPILSELPPPPEDKSGWPWTVESPQLPDAMEDGKPWPRISIITPSCNQGQFIEETIRSVLLQGYPDLEYVVIDGGSSDNSVAIIKKYERWLTYWISEGDRGQSDAIQKGCAHTTGIWNNWLNSDDILLPNALRVVANASTCAPREALALAMSCIEIDKDGLMIGDARCPILARDVWSWLNGPTTIPQASTFIHHSAFLVDVNLHYIMDCALHFSLMEANNDAFFVENSAVAAQRAHDKTKTTLGGTRFLHEAVSFLKTYRYNRKIHRVYAMIWIHKQLARSKFVESNPTIFGCMLAPLCRPILFIDRFYLGTLKNMLIYRLRSWS